MDKKANRLKVKGWKIYSIVIVIIRKLDFCASKDINNRVKRQPMEQEKIFANHMSDKGLISRIYNELLQLNNNNKKNLIKK